MTNIQNIFRSLIQEAIRKVGSQWDEGPFVGIRELQPDNRGEVGERFLCKLFEELGYRVELSQVTDPTKKHWDLRIDGATKLEVKTATLGSTRTFQHENLEKDRDFDGVVLLDVAPDAIYLTFAAKGSIPWTSKNDRWTRAPKKLHRRRQGIAYKWDLSLQDVEERRVETIEDVRRGFETMLAEIEEVGKR